jgi:hypothetical protein
MELRAKIEWSIMTYRIAANCTYTTAANRNTVQTSVTTMLAAYAYSPLAGRWPAGINTTGTTGLTISIEVEDEADARAIGANLVSTLNPTSTKYSNAIIAIYRSPV